MRSYDSFLLRCWGLESERPRIKLEHVQSGASTRVTTLAAALAWINARAGPRPEVPASREPSDESSLAVSEERG